MQTRDRTDHGPQGFLSSVREIGIVEKQVAEAPERALNLTRPRGCYPARESTGDLGVVQSSGVKRALSTGAGGHGQYRMYGFTHLDLLKRRFN